MKRLYVFDPEDNGVDDPVRFAVVHTSLKEAKKWLWSDCRDYCDYLLFNPHWLRIDVSDREIGDDMIGIVGLERGVYEWIDDTCPRCGKSGRLRHYDDWEMVCCSVCEDELCDALILPDGR